MGLFSSLFGKKPIPVKEEMDKHTKRYLNEQFLHYEDEFTFGKAIEIINQSTWTDGAYLDAAIDATFNNEQKQYLRQKMWDKHYGIQ